MVLLFSCHLTQTYTYIAFIVAAEFMWITTYTLLILLGAQTGTPILTALAFITLVFAATELVIFFVFYVLRNQYRTENSYETLNWGE